MWLRNVVDFAYFFTIALDLFPFAKITCSRNVLSLCGGRFISVIYGLSSSIGLACVVHQFRRSGADGHGNGEGVGGIRRRSNDADDWPTFPYQICSFGYSVKRHKVVSSRTILLAILLAMQS